MGIVGYGDIGQATARIARAFRMKVAALRRRSQLSKQDEEEGLQVWSHHCFAAFCGLSFKATRFNSPGDVPKL